MHWCVRDRSCYISEIFPGGWFVVWTESRAEKRVESRIAALGLEPRLPTVTETRRWSDRWRDVETPFFSGYPVARPTAEWPVVLRTRGVLTVVTSGGKPAIPSDGFVQELQEAITRRGAQRRGAAACDGQG